MKKLLKSLILFLIISLSLCMPVSAATKTKSLSKSAKSVTITSGYKYKLKIKKASVKWKAKTNSILKITKSGVITPKAAGKTTVSYKIKGKVKKIAVTVKKSASSKKSVSSVKKKSSSKKKAKNNSGGGTVWLSATGSKYHSINNCGRMNPDKATAVSKSEAESMGFGPCSKCC